MESSLLSLVEFVLFLQLLRWLNLTGSRFSGDIEKVYISLQKSFLHQRDRFRLCCNFLLKFKVVILFLEISSTSRHVLLVLIESICQRFLSILLNDLGLSLVNEFILLLSLRFLLHLSDFRMGVIDWCDFHI